ncbi:MAG: hypothetical protein EZS28_055142 [Streblomastix strix]|uniref:UV excision repair protein RAD23 n=1 Tax=Streblomastix strix TaxID=222440 RepID=A0A5J4Q8D6_9EUKA|nr:MAG: hypothetical protein EZS28_055142 [Streblomastix strix]
MGGAIQQPQQGLPQDLLGNLGTGGGIGQGGQQPGAGGQGTTFGGQRMHQTPQGLAIELTDDDKANVAQIREMTGSSMNAAVQAYPACDKNVEAAINFLFDS